jgi:hypothetical protein
VRSVEAGMVVTDADVGEDAYRRAHGLTDREIEVLACVAACGCTAHPVRMPPLLP